MVKNIAIHQAAANYKPNDENALM